ncbi:MAG TPA: serine O-acetyltransferase, partial [Dehalococcoidia bacterium]|nr:serine O-acetyltransferase [Dehalococcoidia bacterium]
MSSLASIRRDIKAALDRDPAAHSAVTVVLLYPGFHARQLHRLAYALHKAGVPFVPGLIAFLNRSWTGIEIHPGATIGEGLFIDHGMGVVIGETA